MKYSFNKIIIFILIFLLSMTAYAENKWTIMVYMCGDNDLNVFSYFDMNEMESVADQLASKNVEVVVLWDRSLKEDTTAYGVENWEDTRIYTIKQDTDEAKVNSPFVSQTEADMGKPDTVKNFVQHCKTNNPAENYMLVFWDHGSGWYRDSNVVKPKIPEVERSVCSDTSSGDHLDTTELREALTEVKSIIGKKLDIVAFDACLMQMLEVEYELKDCAELMIGSEQTEPGQGWPYNTALLSFVNHTDDKYAIAKEIVDCYIAYYEDWYGQHNQYLNNVTQAVVDLNKISNVATCIKNFVDYSLITFNQDSEPFRYAMSKVAYYDTNSNVDLYHFIALVAEKTRDTHMKDLTKKLLEAIYDSVVYSKVTEKNISYPIYDFLDVSNSHGIAVYFPIRADLYQSDDYQTLNFSKEYNWDSLIDKYYGLSDSSTSASLEKESKVVTIMPSEIYVVRARKNSSGSYDYKKVSESDFMKGYSYLVGNYPYAEYKDDYYQIYMKFDLSSLKENSEFLVLEDAEICHWSTFNKIKDKKIVAALNKTKSQDYVLNDDANLLSETEFSKSNIKGSGLNTQLINWITKPEENYGMIVGYDILGKNAGYMKRFNPAKVYMNIKYHY